jgi:hypothetical protein
VVKTRNSHGSSRGSLSENERNYGKGNYAILDLK